MYTRLLFILLLGATWMCSCQTEQSPVNTLADRVTEGTSKDRILFRMIADENNPLKDYFEISSEDGKVLITGNSDLSLATGLNWYLKYVAGIHLSWNNLSQKLPEILPLPQEKIRKETSMQNRYYLNYCTYSYSMVFWDQIFKEVGEDYPDVKTFSYLVDAASMFMVKDPARFEIVVTSNLFGDILTDLGAAIAGGMGLAAGANLNPEREFPSMFEPIHGSAPDIAGQGKANPLATVWSASQMLDFFGYRQWGEKLIDIIEEILKEKKVLTPDLDGTATTSQVGDEVISKLRL